MAPNRAFIAFNDIPYLEKPVLLSFDVPQLARSPPTELDVALGANISGAGRMKSVIQQARWSWMRDEGKLDLGQTPIMRQDGDSRPAIRALCGDDTADYPICLHQLS